jgi:hypothetical protein
LKKLDNYEGVLSCIFKRVKTQILLKKEISQSAYIYIPTTEFIKVNGLHLELDKNDRWKEEIKKYPKIVRKFPELIL